LPEGALPKPHIPVAGLDPAIHAFRRTGRCRLGHVDARSKSGQGLLAIELHVAISILGWKKFQLDGRAPLMREKEGAYGSTVLV
jgi:hypothetical protein